MNRNRLCFIGAFVVACFLSTTAVADSPIDKETALETDFDELVQQAHGAFSEGNFEAAAEYLVVANQIRPDPRLFINIARSYEEQGDCATSLVYYGAFLDDPTDEPELVSMAEGALDGADDCPEYDADLGKRLVLTSDPQLADVYIDDQRLGLAPTETAGLEPGDYTVRFELDDYEVYTTDIEVESGQSLDISARLQEEIEEEEQDDEPEPDDVEPPPDDIDEVSFSPNPVAIALASAGTAGLITAASFDLFVLPSIDDDIKEAQDNNEHSRASDLSDSRQNWAYSAAGLYIGGGALLAAGGAWLIYDFYSARNEDPADATYGWQVSPQIGDQGARLRLFRRF